MIIDFFLYKASRSRNGNFLIIQKNKKRLKQSRQNFAWQLIIKYIQYSISYTFAIAAGPLDGVSILFYNAPHKVLYFCRYWRAWDYHPQAGLIVAGGASPWTRLVEQSKNYGHSFRQLADIRYGTRAGVQQACLVIIDENTAVLIGGRYNSRFL